MEFIFWSVYVIAALSAAYHTITVFSISDPLLVAIGAAIAIDGLPTYALLMLGKWTGNQRRAGIFGIIYFVLVSGLAQVISRFNGLGIPLPYWLQIVSLSLVPVSTTGSILALGLMHYFGARVEPSLVQPSLQQGISTVVENTPKTETVPQLEVTKTVWPEPPLYGEVTRSANGHEKRKPGRPPKTVFAKDIDPKV